MEIEEKGKITKYNTIGYNLTGIQQSQQGNKKTQFYPPGGADHLKDFKKQS